MRVLGSTLRAAFRRGLAGLTSSAANTSLKSCARFGGCSSRTVGSGLPRNSTHGLALTSLYGLSLTSDYSAETLKRQIWRHRQVSRSGKSKKYDEGGRKWLCRDWQ